MAQKEDEVKYVSRIVEPAAGRCLGEIAAGSGAGCGGVLPADGSRVSLRRGVHAVLGRGGVGVASIF